MSGHFFVWQRIISQSLYCWTNIITYKDGDLVIAGVTIVGKHLDHNCNLPRNAFSKTQVIKQIEINHDHANR